RGARLSFCKMAGAWVRDQGGRRAGQPADPDAGCDDRATGVRDLSHAARGAVAGPAESPGVSGLERCVASLLDTGCRAGRAWRSPGSGLATKCQAEVLPVLRGLGGNLTGPDDGAVRALSSRPGYVPLPTVGRMVRTGWRSGGSFSCPEPGCPAPCARRSGGAAGRLRRNLMESRALLARRSDGGPRLR